MFTIKERFTLKQARMIEDKSQKEMAALLGVSHQTYRKIEDMPYKATVYQIKLFLKATGRTLDQLVIFEEGEQYDTIQN